MKFHNHDLRIYKKTLCKTGVLTQDKNTLNRDTNAKVIKDGLVGLHRFLKLPNPCDFCTSDLTR